jgi:hypothetical protein
LSAAINEGADGKDGKFEGCVEDFGNESTSFSV